MNHVEREMGSPIEQVFQAAKSGDAETLRRLLKADPSLVRTCTEDSEETALHLAASFGHLHLVKLLVERGADINAENFYHQTPLAVADRSGYVEIAEWLRQNGGTEYD